VWLKTPFFWDKSCVTGFIDSNTKTFIQVSLMQPILNELQGLQYLWHLLTLYLQKIDCNINGKDSPALNQATLNEDVWGTDI